MTAKRENIRVAENDWKAIPGIKITIEIKLNEKFKHQRRHESVLERDAQNSTEGLRETRRNQRGESCPWGMGTRAATLETVWKVLRRLNVAGPRDLTAVLPRHSLRRNEGT